LYAIPYIDTPRAFSPISTDASSTQGTHQDAKKFTNTGRLAATISSDVSGTGVTFPAIVNAGTSKVGIFRPTKVLGKARGS
jgi:hypothetical protein